jgi:AraC-like DNA-binding protein
MGALELAVVGLTGSGIGTALGLPMVWPRIPQSRDVRLLGGLLLFLSAGAGVISARLAGFLPAAVAVDHLVNLLGLTGYPLLVLYVAHDRCQLATTRRMWLWAPAAVYAGFIVARGVLSQSTFVPFAWLLPVALSYTAVSAAILFGREGRVTPAPVPATWVLAFTVVLNASQILRMAFGQVGLVPALVPVVVTCGFIAMAAVVASRTVAARPPIARPSTTSRYEKSGLGRELAPDILARIDRALSSDRLFTDPDLTLVRLAACVGYSPHQVSEALNRYARTSFHELLSQRRVDEVKAQLLDPANDRFTIEGIGAAAGFGSRSALHAAFRRFEKMTPAEYRAAQRSSSAVRRPTRGAG